MAALPGAVTVTAPPLLEVEHLSFSYGPLQVLFDVSFTVPAGGTICLLGTNGAGKSTLLRAVAGLAPPSGGRVLFDGEDVTRARAEERFARGMALVEGGRATCGSLSVEENLRLGAFPFLRDRSRVRDGMERAYAAFPALAAKQGQQAGTLSGGEQQMLALGRALVSSPRLLMIDELSLGLAPVVMQVVVEAVEEMALSGVTLLLVEQSLNVAVAVADEGYFMEKGEIRYSGRTDELLARGDLVRSVFFGVQR